MLYTTQCSHATLGMGLRDEATQSHDQGECIIGPLVCLCTLMRFV